MKGAIIGLCICFGGAALGFFSDEFLKIKAPEYYFIIGFMTCGLAILAYFL